MGRIIYCVLIAFFSSRLLAYPTPIDLDGKLHKWPIKAEDPYVNFEVIGDEDLLPILMEISLDAANTWSAVEQSMLRIREADTENSAHITINFQSSITGGDMAAGYSIFDEVDNGVPRHCSITIAADPLVDTYNLAKTTIHEIGHCLGLGHSLIPESIMSYSLDRNSLSLSADDRAVISRIYPLDGSSPKLAPGCAISGIPDQQPRPILFFLMILAPFVWALARKIMTPLVKN